MTYYLRTKGGKTILDVECWIKREESNSFVELSSVVDIKNYSILLLENTDQKKQVQIIADFDQLSELRGWLWEVFFMVKKNTEKEFDGVKTELKAILKKVADKYGLFVVED